MKIAKLLIIAAALLAVVAVIARISLIPLAGVSARALMGFAGLLLLFAIALEGLKIN